MSKSEESLNEQVKALRGDLTAKRMLREFKALPPERREKLMTILKKQTFSPEETGEILGKPTGTIRRWLRDGTLKGIKLQRSWMIPRTEIEKLLGHSVQGQAVESTATGTDNITETFKHVCADRGEDPDEVMKNLMAEYVKAANESKEQEEKSDEERQELRRLLEKRQRNAKIIIT